MQVTRRDIIFIVAAVAAVLLVLYVGGLFAAPD